MALQATRIRRTLIAVAVLCAGTARGEETLDRWQDLDFTRRGLTLEELESLTLTELKLLRGLVFGRHGRIFKDPEIREWLQTRSWYVTNPGFGNEELSDEESSTLYANRATEARRHARVEPGDLRFIASCLLTDRDVGEHPAEEWRILRGEALAIPHAVFPANPVLQAYFDERYWYQPEWDGTVSALSPVELENLATIRQAQERQVGHLVLLGEMGDPRRPTSAPSRGPSCRQSSSSLADRLALRSASAARRNLVALREAAAGVASRHDAVEG